MTAMLRELFLGRGVDCVGVCRFSDGLPLLPVRARSRLPDSPRSVIVCLFPYHIGDFPRRNVARYAALRDYHTVAGAILERAAERLRVNFPGESFVPFVDNSPFREVKLAQAAGLGAVGTNGLLIHPRYGSFVLIGAIAATLELPSSPPAPGSCLECGRCMAACPTGALREDRFDPSRCRSFITQKKGALDEWEREQLRAGGLAWGCDLCQEACPMNRDLPLTSVTGFYERPAPLLTTENLDALLPEKPYGWRGRAVLQRNLEILGKSGQS